jgi:hypothetical protein
VQAVDDDPHVEGGDLDGSLGSGHPEPRRDLDERAPWTRVRCARRDALGVGPERRGDDGEDGEEPAAM